MMLGFTTGGNAKLGPRETSIGSRLPYAGHIDPSTIRTRDGMLIQTLHLKGFPFETQPDEELNYRKTVRETLLRGAATSRLAIYHHVVRRRASPRFTGTFDEPFSARVDAAWKARLSERSLYVNDLFLTLVWRPVQGQAGFLDKLFRPVAGPVDLDRDVRNLTAIRDTFAAALAPYGARVLTTYQAGPGLCSEPAEFASMIVNAQTRPILAPSGDMGEAIPARRLNFGLDAMEFAAEGAAPAQFGAIVSLKDYPARSMPGMFDGVLRLPFELVLTESFSFVDRQASLDRMSLALRRLRAADNDAFSLRGELASARDEVGAGRAAYGEHHLTVMTKAASLPALDDAVAEVQSALAEAGAIAVREDVNLEPAFWAQFPGNLKYVARKALVSVANFASLASLHGHPLGETEGLHWGDPVTVLETTAFGPYNFNFHAGDLGNFTVIGPSGSGKTALLTFLVAQARKFRPRVVYFDKDRGAEIFVRASGGRYDMLSPGEPSGLNPLLLDDTPENRAFLAEWVERLVVHDGEAALSPEDRAIVVDAIDAAYAQDPKHRRLRYLRDLVRGVRRPSAGDLAARLAPWCDNGEHAWLFDNAEDRLDLEASLLGFDMTRLLDHPKVRTPAMMYLFHRVEQRLDGQPTIVIVDEGWKALDDEIFVQRIRDWQKTIRKKNGIVGFCTQSAGDALESRISQAIVEQAATQIFFPNSRARAADYIDGFGLSEHEFDLVRTLPDTSRCFLIKQADHSVVARLDLTGVGGGLIKVLAGNERSVRRLDALRAQYGDDPAAWLEPFLNEGPQ